jgi:hypothetical protein
LRKLLLVAFPSFGENKKQEHATSKIFLKHELAS